MEIPRSVEREGTSAASANEGYRKCAFAVCAGDAKSLRRIGGNRTNAQGDSKAASVTDERMLMRVLRERMQT